jgi:hypothetical protein
MPTVGYTDEELLLHYGELALSAAVRPEDAHYLSLYLYRDTQYGYDSFLPGQFLKLYTRVSRHIEYRLYPAFQDFGKALLRFKESLSEIALTEAL